MLNKTTFCEIELSNSEHSEKNRRFIQNAIELALSLGDFQKEINHHCTHQAILKKTAERIGRLVAFEASALYQVDEEDSDFRLSVCKPKQAKKKIEKEVDFLIENGFIAWAIRERRGVTVYSKDGSQKILLHVLATYSCIRGLFIGIFPEGMKRLPNAALEILSIILRNSANGLESLQYSGFLLRQKNHLETTVEENTRKMIQFERQLMQAQKMEAIAVLAGGIAHQFNNALTGLIGNLDLMQLKVGKNPEIDRYLERTRSLTGRMTGLTRQLLAYVQGGKYSAGKVSLKQMLNDIGPALRRSLKPSVELTVDLPDDNLTAVMDVAQMQVAISAIVNNADEAIGNEGSIQISAVKVRVDGLPAEDNASELEPGEYVCISIQDTGGGMDRNTLRRVFEPFFTTKFEGRGLSMAAVFGIIKNHNGRICLESQVGRGSIVRIYLPCTH